ncbi:S8 family serine peptidase [Fulvivirga sp. 29W222]|uniref:S8 family serine peptidase n=1 Tax=Fulvivirga marina TaxID=2494733 RepID=A0A937KDP0_9BACT|nr:S8 family serine peptidase [Fulvivirga marina]MBL6448832.1 S8 family serine peptidase [Fulvivirga marina]
MLKKHLISALLVCFSVSIYAQVNRYMVFFSDKANTPYTVGSPEAFLSSRAISRRQDQGIPITTTDLPVDPAYIAGVNGVGAEVFYTTKWLNGALIQADAGLISSIEALGYVDSVVYIAPGSKLMSSGRLLEVGEENQTEGSTAVQLGMLGLDLLHEKGYKGEGVMIAFFDGGYKGVNTVEAFQHIYNENRLLYAWNLVENNNNVYQYSTHGTRVFSATAGFLTGAYEGSAYKSDFMLFVTEDASSEYRIEEYNWLIAAEKADSAGVDIINGSVGYFDFDDPGMNYTYKDMDGKTTIISQAAKFASDRGLLVVVSAGNEGNKTWKYVTAPADAENILSVGSVDSNGSISNFSSLGPSSDGRIKPEVMAYGGATAVVNDFGSIINGTGTSFATPLITGFAATLWQLYPNLTNTELISFILENSSNTTVPDNQYGYGVPSYRFIVSSIADGVTHDFSVYPNPLTSDLLNIRMTSEVESVDIKLYDVSGSLIRTYKVGAPSVSMPSTISLDGVKEGLYLLELNSGKNVESYRIVRY